MNFGSVVPPSCARCLPFVHGHNNRLIQANQPIRRLRPTCSMLDVAVLQGRKRVCIEVDAAKGGRGGGRQRAEEPRRNYGGRGALSFVGVCVTGQRLVEELCRARERDVFGGRVVSGGGRYTESAKAVGEALSSARSSECAELDSVHSWGIGGSSAGSELGSRAGGEFGRRNEGC